MRSTIEMLSKRRDIIAISVLFICLVLGSYAESSILLQDHNVPEKDQQGLWAERHHYYLLPNPDCCRSLAQDGNYLWVGTSAGAVRWNLKENTYQLFKADDDWSMLYAKKLGMNDDNASWRNVSWRSEKARQYLNKWVTNAVEKIVVLSPGHVWVDTLKGAMIIHGDRKVVYPSVEDALAAIYHTKLRPTLGKVVAMDKNGHLWLLKEIGEPFDNLFDLLHYDGTAWKSDEQVGIRKLRRTPRIKYNIADILADAQGNLWACNFDGIYRHLENRWEQVLREARYGYGEMRLGTSGTLWAFGWGTLARFAGDQWEVFDGTGRYKDFSLSFPYMGKQAVVLETPDGKLWFEASFVESDTCAFMCFDGKGFSQASFCPVAAMSNNTGQTFAASGERLFRYDKGKWKQLAMPPFRMFRLVSLFGGGQKTKIIDDILVAKDGTVYVAVEQECLLRYRKGSWKRMSCDKAKQETKSIEQDVAEGMAKMSEEERFLVLGVGPVPEALVKNMHKAYVEGEGKELIKASDQQLAEHIVQGKDSTSAISYYRLLSRNRKLAKASLHKKIERMCASDYGEGWISLEIAGYGPPVIEILLKIAKMGTAEQRALAIDSLSFMRDPKVVDELFGILGNLEKLDKLSYLRLARAAIMAGNPKGMELLIEAATTENDFQKICRDELDRVTKTYDDLPGDWSQEKWNAWWKKHRGSWKLDEAYPGVMSTALITSSQKIYKAVAEKVEKEIKQR